MTSWHFLLLYICYFLLTKHSNNIQELNSPTIEEYSKYEMEISLCYLSETSRARSLSPDIVLLMNVISCTRHVISFPTSAAPLITEIAAVEWITNLCELRYVTSTITPLSMYHFAGRYSQANRESNRCCIETVKKEQFMSNVDWRASLEWQQYFVFDEGL
jgi:hypothetical protein